MKADALALMGDPRQPIRRLLLICFAGWVASLGPAFANTCGQSDIAAVNEITTMHLNSPTSFNEVNFRLIGHDYPDFSSRKPNLTEGEDFETDVKTYFVDKNMFQMIFTTLCENAIHDLPSRAKDSAPSHDVPWLLRSSPYNAKSINGYITLDAVQRAEGIARASLPSTAGASK
jgi:hypothetical protein